MPDRPPPQECANCGARIPRHAKACPECGADELTGWRETSAYDGLDLPDSAFEDAETEQSARHVPHKVNGIAWYWWMAAGALVAAFVLGVLAFR